MSHTLNMTDASGAANTGGVSKEQRNDPHRSIRPRHDPAAGLAACHRPGRRVGRPPVPAAPVTAATRVRESDCPHCSQWPFKPCTPDGEHR